MRGRYRTESIRVRGLRFGSSGASCDEAVAAMPAATERRLASVAPATPGRRRLGE